MSKLEERTEYVTIKVTPTVKKEFQLMASNEEMQDAIIRRFAESEIKMIEEDMRQIDEYSIRYRARLLAIKDNYQGISDVHNKEIDDIYTTVHTKLKGFDKISEKLERDSEKTLHNFKKIAQSIEYVPVDRFERLLTCIEKFKQLSTEEQELIEKLIKK